MRDREFIAILAASCLSGNHTAKERVDMAEAIIGEVNRRHPQREELTDITDLREGDAAHD